MNYREVKDKNSLWDSKFKHTLFLMGEINFWIFMIKRFLSRKILKALKYSNITRIFLKKYFILNFPECSNICKFCIIFADCFFALKMNITWNYMSFKYKD